MARFVLDARTLRDDYPGIGRYVWGLLRHLPAAAPGDEIVAIVDPTAPNERFSWRQLAAPNLFFHRLPVAPRSLAEQLRLPPAVAGLRADLLHAPYPATALRSPCPRVVTVHDVIPLRPEGGFSPLGRMLFRCWLDAVACRSWVLTPSESSRRELLQQLELAPQRVRAVLSGIDVGRDEPSRPMVGTAGTSERYILCLAADRPHKNLRCLEDAWRSLSDEARRGHVLVLAGGDFSSGPEDGILRIGRVAEGRLAGLYRGASLVVVPSLWEGFGFSALEAMAHGVPVACSGAGALSETAGDATALFDPRSPSSIAEVVAGLLVDDAGRRRLSQAGRRRAEAFVWPEAARRTVAVYREVLVAGAGV